MEFTERYAIPGIPVLLEGLADDWPALRLWTFDFFARNYGGRTVTVYAGSRKVNGRPTKLGAYLKYMEETSDEIPDYLSRWRLSSSLSALRAHYRRPAHFSCWSDRLPRRLTPTWKWLYFGPRNTGSAMHIDFMGTAAWNALFVGTKTWRFYPPDQTSLVYKGEVDAFLPDPDRFPLFAEARGLSCVQGPGDVVFTPSNWWHQVRNETCTLALTENFVNDTNAHHLNAEPGDTHERRLLRLLLQYAPDPAVGLLLRQ